jgi:hypothetical protein
MNDELTPDFPALSGGWIKRLSGISGDQLTKLKNKAPPKISDSQKIRMFWKICLTGS